MCTRYPVHSRYPSCGQGAKHGWWCSLCVRRRPLRVLALPARAGGGGEHTCHQTIAPCIYALALPGSHCYCALHCASASSLASRRGQGGVRHAQWLCLAHAPMLLCGGLATHAPCGLPSRRSRRVGSRGVSRMCGALCSVFAGAFALACCNSGRQPLTPTRPSPPWLRTPAARA